MAQNGRLDSPALSHGPRMFRPIIYHPIIYRPIIYRPIIYRPIIYRPLIYRRIIYRPMIYRLIIYHPIIHLPRSQLPWRFGQSHAIKYQVRVLSPPGRSVVQLFVPQKKQKSQLYYFPTVRPTAPRVAQSCEYPKRNCLGKSILMSEIA